MNPVSPSIQSQLTAWLLRKTATSGARRVAPLRAAVASDIGCVREENQDRAVISRGKDREGQEYAVVAVADGIGGMREGANCAAITLSSFLTSMYQHAQLGADSSEEWLRRAVNAANQAVFTRFRGDGGSTLVALLVRPGQPVFWLSVGDSRVYRSTGRDLTQISVDDTIAGQLGKNAEATFEQSKLLQFIGMGDEMEPHIADLDVEPVDALVLTTDGVHYLAPRSGWLGQIVGNAPDPGLCVKRIVDLAKWCGGPDNATVAIISLPADMESGNQPPYQCLEVWDAFGELQIITNDASSIARHQEAPTAAQLLVTAPDAFTQIPASANDSDSMKPKQEISNIRRSKRTRKAKGLKDNGATESTETEAPQLLVDFSSKSDDKAS